MRTRERLAPVDAALSDVAGNFGEQSAIFSRHVWMEGRKGEGTLRKIAQFRLTHLSQADPFIRILVDQLVMAYGISGQLKKAHGLLDEAIPQDPDYPLNYYNLACAFAEEGNKDKAFANLALAFQHKDQVLKGEQMADPRSDSSFQKYIRDDDFLSLMKALGFK